VTVASGLQDQNDSPADPPRQANSKTKDVMNAFLPNALPEVKEVMNATVGAMLRSAAVSDPITVLPEGKDSLVVLPLEDLRIKVVTNATARAVLRNVLVANDLTTALPVERDSLMVIPQEDLTTRGVTIASPPKDLHAEKIRMIDSERKSLLIQRNAHASLTTSRRNTLQ
jgi:hypothetical protein